MSIHHIPEVRINFLAYQLDWAQGFATIQSLCHEKAVCFLFLSECSCLRH